VKYTDYKAEVSAIPVQSVQKAGSIDKKSQNTRGIWCVMHITSK